MQLRTNVPPDENGTNPVISISDEHSDERIKLGLFAGMPQLSFERSDGEDGWASLGMFKGGVALGIGQRDGEAIMELRDAKPTISLSKGMEWPPDYDEEWAKTWRETDGREVIWSAPCRLCPHPKKLEEA